MAVTMDDYSQNSANFQFLGLNYENKDSYGQPQKVLNGFFEFE